MGKKVEIPTRHIGVCECGEEFDARKEFECQCGIVWFPQVIRRVVKKAKKAKKKGGGEHGG